MKKFLQLTDGDGQVLAVFQSKQIAASKKETNGISIYLRSGQTVSFGNLDQDAIDIFHQKLISIDEPELGEY